MKSFSKFFGIIILAVVIGFSFTGCAMDETGGGLIVKNGSGDDLHLRIFINSIPIGHPATLDALPTGWYGTELTKPLPPNGEYSIGFGMIICLIFSENENTSLYCFCCS